MKPRNTISQREARRLRRRVAQLENELSRQRYAWATAWPSGVNIDTINVLPVEFHIAMTARKLGHAVVIVPRMLGDQGQFLVYALPLPKTKEVR